MEKNMVCDMYSGVCKPSEENEVMYDIKQDEVPNFVEQNLSPSVYTAKNILGENYYEFILS